MRKASEEDVSESSFSVSTSYGASVTTIPRAVNRGERCKGRARSARQVESAPYRGHEGPRVLDCFSHQIVCIIGVQFVIGTYSQAICVSQVCPYYELLRIFHCHG